MKLLDLLELEDLGSDVYAAPTPDSGQRLHGGRVLFQTLWAASRSVEAARSPHSVHAHFVRRGIPGQPLHLEIERLREGRTFSLRRVHAVQEGEPVLIATLSFHADEPGADWQLPVPVDVPDPDLPQAHEPRVTRFPPMAMFDVRAAEVPGPEGFSTIHPYWVRAKEELPGDPIVHACTLAFLSDVGVTGSAHPPSTPLREHLVGTSLDHALWFHRPVRADDWLLLSVDPVSNFGNRGLARGTFYDHTGALAASLTQEVLLRGTAGARVRS